MVIQITVRFLFELTLAARRQVDVPLRFVLVGSSIGRAVVERRVAVDVSDDGLD